MALQNKLKQADILWVQLDKLWPISPEQQAKLDEKLRLEFHYNTNHIEGNTLTYGETKLAILFDQVSEGHSLREYEEMKASDLAYKLVQELAKDKERPLSESFIKNLNKTLLVREYWKEAITPDGQSTSRLISIGEYKKHPNSVRLENGEIFQYASPAETPAMMTELIDWYRAEEKNKEFHPVITAAALHYRFVRIHPFDDGNGRVSRLLMNYVLFKHGYPPVVIKSEDKPNYLRALNRADAGDVEAFAEYIADQLIWSLELSITAAKGEDVEEPRDWEKQIALLKRQLANDNEIKIAKSPRVIDNLFINVILPLFRKTITSVGKYNELFMSNRTSLYATNSPQIDVEEETINSHYNANKQLFEKATSIGLIVAYFQYKQKGISRLNISANLLIEYEEYEYKIYVTDTITGPSFKKLFTKYYDEQLTDREVEQIINALANTLMYAIKVNIDKTK